MLNQPPIIYKTWEIANQITKHFLQNIEPIKIKTCDVEKLCHSLGQLVLLQYYNEANLTHLSLSYVRNSIHVATENFAENLYFDGFL